MADVTDLQSRIASIIDQDVDTPTAGGDDWNLRLKYLNRAQNKWQEAYDWPQLYKEVNALTSHPTGNATISLPSDFRRLSGYPKITYDGTNTEEFAEIDPQKRAMYSSSDFYCYLLGNPSGGYNLIVNPGSLVSGASVFISYWASAGTLASPADVSMCPDPEYVVNEAIAQLWESREDPRFPEMKSEADRRLMQMVENTNTKSEAHRNEAMTPEETKYSFRLGRD